MGAGASPQPQRHQTAKNQPGSAYREQERYDDDGQDMRDELGTLEIAFDEENFGRIQNTEMFDIQIGNFTKGESADIADDKHDVETPYSVPDKNMTAKKNIYFGAPEDKEDDVIEVNFEEDLASLMFDGISAQNVGRPHQADVHQDDDDNSDVEGFAFACMNDKNDDELKESSSSDDELPRNRLKVRFID